MSEATRGVEQGMESWGHLRRGFPRVLVVGGGVSGCACGATIAAEGFAVTILHSALDTVGLPSFGPDLCGGADCISKVVSVLGQLPPELGGVWLDACLVPESGAECVAVDRRRLGVETKRAVEAMERLEFRQGLAEDVRPVWSAGTCGGERAADVGGEGAWGLEVETAFGEVIGTEVLILAPGLSLGGRVRVGDQLMVGGRYGETPSEGLREALERLGAEWKEVSVSVGPRYLGGAEGVGGPVDPRRAASGAVTGRRAPLSDTLAATLSVAAMPLRKFLARVGGTKGGKCESGRESGVALGGQWPAEYPPSPYWSELEGLPGFASVVPGGPRAERSDGYAAYPDGLVTRELCVLPSEPRDARGARNQTAARLEQEVSGLVVANVDVSSRLRLKCEGSPEVWVAGRAAGATDYLKSLSSGIRVGRAVAELLRAVEGPSGEAFGEAGPAEGYGA